METGHETIPLVTFVIPCFNDGDYLERAVDSAILQTYEKKEIIIVDDGSNLETKKSIEKLRSKIDLILTQDNRGLSAARNSGISAAKGKYIIVLDSDDYFEPTFCEKAVLLIEKEYRFYKIITCQARRFNSAGTIDIFTPIGGNILNFLFSNSAIGNSLYVKKDWSRIEGYDENMTSGFEDWEFYIRLLKDGGEAFVINEPLFNYRQKKNSMRLEANKIRYDLWEYIFLKHSELYKNHFTLFTKHLINTIREEEKKKLKIGQNRENKIGKIVLYPFRLLKSKFQ